MFDDSQNLSLRIGEAVWVNGIERQGLVESIRIISRASVVEEYNGAPNDVVITVQMEDAVINKRGIEIVPLNKQIV